MHDAPNLQEVISLAALLPPEDRRRLAETTLRDLAAETPGPRRFWREIRGSVPYPLCGEDAQACICRGRREADEQREQQRSSNDLEL